VSEVSDTNVMRVCDVLRGIEVSEHPLVWITGSTVKASTEPAPFLLFGGAEKDDATVFAHRLPGALKE
jgi:hypothetical protein